MGTKGVPLLCDSLLGDAEDGAVDCHGAVIEHAVCAQPAFEDDLQLRGQRRRGDEDRYEPKKVIFRTTFYLRFLTPANTGTSK